MMTSNSHGRLWRIFQADVEVQVSGVVEKEKGVSPFPNSYRFWGASYHR